MALRGSGAASTLAVPVVSYITLIFPMSPTLSTATDSTTRWGARHLRTVYAESIMSATPSAHSHQQESP